MLHGESLINRPKNNKKLTLSTFLHASVRVPPTGLKNRAEASLTTFRMRRARISNILGHLTLKFDDLLQISNETLHKGPEKVAFLPILAL